jgi:hypothetical protein
MNRPENSEFTSEILKLTFDAKDLADRVDRFLNQNQDSLTRQGKNELKKASHQAKNVSIFLMRASYQKNFESPTGQKAEAKSISIQEEPTVLDFKTSISSSSSTFTEDSSESLPSKDSEILPVNNPETPKSPFGNFWGN